MQTLEVLRYYFVIKGIFPIYFSISVGFYHSLYTHTYRTSCYRVLSVWNLYGSSSLPILSLMLLILIMLFLYIAFFAYMRVYNMLVFKLLPNSVSFCLRDISRGTFFAKRVVLNCRQFYQCDMLLISCFWHVFYLVMKILIQYYKERQCLLKCIRWILMRASKCHVVFMSMWYLLCQFFVWKAATSLLCLGWIFLLVLLRTWHFMQYTLVLCLKTVLWRRRQKSYFMMDWKVN